MEGFMDSIGALIAMVLRAAVLAAFVWVALWLLAQDHTYLRSVGVVFAIDAVVATAWTGYNIMKS